MASKDSKDTLIHLQLTFRVFKSPAILNLTRARQRWVTNEPRSSQERLPYIARLRDKQEVAEESFRKFYGKHGAEDNICNEIQRQIIRVANILMHC